MQVLKSLDHILVGPVRLYSTPQIIDMVYTPSICYGHKANLCMACVCVCVCGVCMCVCVLSTRVYVYNYIMCMY